MSNATFQESFEAQWGFLTDPHVRALAGLLTSPSMLNTTAPQWQGHIQFLAKNSDELIAWLTTLNQFPQALHQRIAQFPSNRLGHYAENLLAFYFKSQHQLVAHNVQVRSDAHHTIGEFDFLIQESSGLTHWELATKFYLLVTTQVPITLNSFLGPNLADSLGLKIQKVLAHQLKLSEHPAAKVYLPQPVMHTYALMKGWLFYEDMQQVVPDHLGIEKDHNRGFWCSFDVVHTLKAEAFVFIERLQWLAPVKVPEFEAVSCADMVSCLEQWFLVNPTPMMVALCKKEGGYATEIQRGFIVPDSWYQKALEKVYANVE